MEIGYADTVGRRQADRQKQDDMKPLRCKVPDMQKPD